MTVFISYARANQTAAEQLRDDVERCHRDVWLDQELTGGQSWWKAILRHIRECDVFLVVLSSEWIQSTACDLELRYALALGRPILPVMVTKLDPRLAPPAIVDAQIVDYRQRSPETIFALRDALDTLPSAPPLPEPLPAEPAAPISYLHNIIVMLNAPFLDTKSQLELWQNLQSVLDEADGDERVELLKLVRRLRKRRDLVPALYAEIDAVLGPTNPSPPTDPHLGSGQRTSPPTDAPLYPHRPAWEEPTRMLPRPRAQPPPSRSRRGLIWASAGVFVLLLALTIWIGINLGKGSRGEGNLPATQTTATTTDAPTQTSTSSRTSSRRPPVRITMLDLAGLNRGQADSNMRGQGWKGRLVEVSKKVDTPDQDGLIIDHRPNAGIKIAEQDKIEITVGKFEPGPSTSTALPTDG